MDFIKSAMDTYQKSQGQGHTGQQNPGNNQAGGDFGVTGGSRFNAPNSVSSGQLAGDLDGDGIIDTANNDSGNAGDRDLFSQALGFLKNSNTQVDDDLDEDDVVQKHNQAYEKGNTGSLDANGMGAAAALQALKRFTSNSGSAPAQSAGGQSALVAMAMSEASKLFDKSGGAAGGNKQDAVNSAGMMVMKMLLKSQLSGAAGTGGGGGGVGQLLGMASKFM